MADEEHLMVLKQGIDVWNQWRTKNPQTRPDLSGVRLPEADLSWADLSRADLSGADLFRADLSGTDLAHVDLNRANLREAGLRLTHLHRANLERANLQGADLGRADLSWADFFEADLGANLRQSNLIGANLKCAKLHGADFTNCVMGWTDLGNLDVRGVKGLETVKHQGPSTIGIDTLYRSNGKVPEVFLRGAGIGDEFINAIKSLDGAARFYSCCISYSSKDQPFAERLYRDLQAKRVRCWYAPEHLKVGDKFRRQIDEAVRLHDKLLVVLSEHSVNSEWIAPEVEAALERERALEGGSVLFPIRLDEVVMTSSLGWAAEVRRTRQIADLAHWQDQGTYQKAFECLLENLSG